MKPQKILNIRYIRRPISLSNFEDFFYSMKFKGRIRFWVQIWIPGVKTPARAILRILDPVPFFTRDPERLKTQNPDLG
jgi:hypothetical protein